jgi:hypothetical protein
MKQYEYIVEQVQDLNTLPKLLNSLGKEGWEVISVIPKEYMPGQVYAHNILLKREIEK